MDYSTRLHFSADGSFTAETVQDVEDIIENNKVLREQTTHGRDFRHKWNLPAVMVHKFYNEYNEGLSETRPMNQEFWLWVDRKLNDPDLAKFRTSNPSNPFRLGYR